MEARCRLEEDMDMGSLSLNLDACDLPILMLLLRRLQDTGFFLFLQMVAWGLGQEASCRKGCSQTMKAFWGLLGDEQKVQGARCEGTQGSWLRVSSWGGWRRSCSCPSSPTGPPRATELTGKVGVSKAGVNGTLAQWSQCPRHLPCMGTAPFTAHGIPMTSFCEMSYGWRI